MSAVSQGKLCLDAVSTASGRVGTECRADVTQTGHNWLLHEDQAAAAQIDAMLAVGRTEDVIDFVFGAALRADGLDVTQAER